MKTTNYLWAFGIFGLVLFAACEKDNNDIPVLTPKEQILTSKVWKMHSITVPGTEDPSTDSLITKECADSALFVFDVYKRFQIADPVGNCDSTIVPYEKGNWSLSAADSLTLNGARRKLTWKVNTLNDSIVKATFRDSIAPDKNWLKTITLKK